MRVAINNQWYVELVTPGTTPRLMLQGPENFYLARALGVGADDLVVWANDAWYGLVQVEDVPDVPSELSIYDALTTLFTTPTSEISFEIHLPDRDIVAYEDHTWEEKAR